MKTMMGFIRTKDKTYDFYDCKFYYAQIRMK